MNVSLEEERTRGASRVLSDIERRLTRLGLGALSNRELCALLGVTQSRLLEAIEQRGLSSVLLGVSLDELKDTFGLNHLAGLRLVAAAELGRRSLNNDDRRPTLATPFDVHRYLQPMLVQLPREEVHVLCLSPRNVLLKHHRVGVGTIDSCAVDVREVFAPALAARATGLVLVHNHPSGSPEPSTVDIELTQHISTAGRLLGIRLLDHVIIGLGGFVSLSARGIFDGRPTHLMTTHASAMESP